MLKERSRRPRLSAFPIPAPNTAHVQDDARPENRNTTAASRVFERAASRMEFGYQFGWNYRRNGGDAYIGNRPTA